MGPMVHPVCLRNHRRRTLRGSRLAVAHTLRQGERSVANKPSICLLFLFFAYHVTMIRVSYTISVKYITMQSTSIVRLCEFMVTWSLRSNWLQGTAQLTRMQLTIW